MVAVTIDTFSRLLFFFGVCAICGVVNVVMVFCAYRLNLQMLCGP